jgi:hypothetical protein
MGHLTPAEEKQLLLPRVRVEAEPSRPGEAPQWRSGTAGTHAGKCEGEALTMAPGERHPAWPRRRAAGSDC